jgi:hypothetical protein
MLLIIEKVLLSVISIGTLTLLIIGMYLEKFDKATLMLHRNIENFSNNKKERERDEKNQVEKDYQSFQYKPYEKQEGFRSNPKVIEGLDIGKSIRDAFMKPFKPLIEFFQKVKKAFEDIPKRAKNFGDAFKYVGDGIKLEFVNLGKSLDLGFNDIFDVIGTAGNCGVHWISSFRTCFPWYCLDGFLQLLYSMFITLPVYIIKVISGIDLEPYVLQIICLIDQLDALCFEYTCWHFNRFPDWVIAECYSCKLNDKVNKLKLDWRKTIPDLLNAPAQKFSDAKHKFESVFAADP